MNEWRPLVLIVEDDEEMARLNGRLLARNGCDVALAASAAEARELARVRQPDLFVLDIMLPDGDGLALCEEFRLENDAPVLFLTGKREPRDKVIGLCSGGDYYLTKPYDTGEFVAVAQSLLRRAEKTRQRIAEATEITRGALTLQLPQAKALVKGHDAGLTQKEFAVLLLLARNEDHELSSETIYESVWGTGMNDDNGAVRQTVSRLKKKLGAEDTDDFSIVTFYGGGYAFTMK